MDLGAFESTLARRIDTDAPVTTATPTPAPNGAGWNNTDVTVTLNATDGAGTGVKEIVYSVSGAQTAGGDSSSAASLSHKSFSSF